MGEASLQQIQKVGMPSRSQFRDYGNEHTKRFACRAGGWVQLVDLKV